MLGRNANYVEGIAVTDVPYVAKDGKAVLKKDDTLLLENGGFEKHDGDRFPINGWIDEPGKRSFADTEVKHGGKCSVRLENFDSNKHGHGRICLQVKLMPCMTISTLVASYEKAERSHPAEECVP